MEWIFNKMDYKWIGLEQKWIRSIKLDFLPTPNTPTEVCTCLLFS